MKTISLIPVRNEGWILKYTLQNISSFSDVIIVADQNSKDNTREICKEFKKVILISNMNEGGHSNTVRWLLLDEARKIDGNNLIICIDADEMVSPLYIEKLKDLAKTIDPGTTFSFPWIQLWKSTNKYRLDGVWNKSIKPIAFLDDHKMDYRRSMVINDHTSRIPEGKTNLRLDFPILHFQFAAWNRTEVKQVWYRCAELIASPNTAKKINYKYKDSLDDNAAMTETVPAEWTNGMNFPDQNILDSEDNIRLREIMAWFEKYGIGFFEPLQIWHISVLREEFEKTMAREPKPRIFPKILVFANDFKNKLRAMIKI